jgi:translocation and assembly module TamA
MRLRYIIIFLWIGALSAEIPYDVEFCGVESRETVAMLKAASQLVTLEEYPPTTMTALRRRADADIPIMKKALQSLGYYDPKIGIDIQGDECNAQVNVTVDTGPVFPIRKFEIIDVTVEPCELLTRLDLKNIGIIYGRDAIPKTILDAEKTLLFHLSTRGYPLASVTSREVIADLKCNEIDVILRIDVGPKACMGTIEISGNCDVDEQFIYNKIIWDSGDQYDPTDIEKTQNALEASGLFSSVTIEPADELDENGLLPISIEVSESKHRSIALGGSYNTQRGPGLMGEWEHRNIRGMGEKLRIRADVWGQLQRGAIIYSVPDFLCPRQDWVNILEVKQEFTDGFSERFVSFSSLLERQINDNLRISYGAAFKEFDSNNSDNNGLFTLIKAPLMIKYSTANNLMDPSKGKTVTFKIIPTWSVLKHQFVYAITTLTGTHYTSLREDKRLILALKGSLGSIFGSSDIEIPPPERFYEGNENTLRGYRYLTVCPLVGNKPIGGRSLAVLSTELRGKITEKFGLVAFYEIGNVYSNVFPSLSSNQLQSAGFGLRYDTPVGPLRADMAFPLTPRKGFDKSFEVYFSIGQAF